VWIGWLEFDLLLGDVRSLKQKRSVIRPVIAELQRRFAVRGRNGIASAPTSACSVVSRSRASLTLLDATERLVASRPEMELLSARRGLRRSGDD
jgi:uncharacterized protein YlxP (DUF503 family)